MIVLVFILTLLDAAILSVSGVLPGLVMVLVVVGGLLWLPKYKSWYYLAFVYISLASLLYIFGSSLIDETIVHKLSDWSLTFLLIGTVQLARK